VALSEHTIYRTYSQYLQEKYFAKVYKLPVNLPGTCPNRDGTLSIGGCVFCGEKGAGHEALPSFIPVREQLMSNMEYIRKRYKAGKFIAYFQNFSNTYFPAEQFARYIRDACMEDIVEIAVSTRPDCIFQEHLDLLKRIKHEQGIEVSLELGLQTVNYHTLRRINRGHGLSEFIRAVLMIHNAGLEVCAHMILDLPWDDREDVKEGAEILSALGVEQVKLHSLNVVKGTTLAQWYEKGEISLLSMEEYMERVILFLEHVSPDMVIQRLIGRVPEEDSLLANWNTSWWRIRDDIVQKMIERGTFQGKKSMKMQRRILDRLQRNGR